MKGREGKQLSNVMYGQDMLYACVGYPNTKDAYTNLARCTSMLQLDNKDTLR